MANEFHDIGLESTVDADAVCAICGEVNPEGTLLCKQCGNNLRDQRAQRVAQGTSVEDMMSEGGSRWLRGALTVLGILVVLWTTLNVGRIEDWLVSAQSVTGAERFWSGSDSAAYEALATEMQRFPLSEDEKASAIESPVPGQGLDGHYVLVRKDAKTATIPLGGSPYLGEAMVRTDQDDIMFVATLYRTDVEIRGFARFEREKMPVVRETAGIRIGRQFLIGSGIGQVPEQGRLECFGQSETDSGGYEIVAYRAR